MAEHHQCTDSRLCHSGICGIQSCVYSFSSSLCALPGQSKGCAPVVCIAWHGICLHVHVCGVLSVWQHAAWATTV
jgi:hypothetical protein